MQFKNLLLTFITGAFSFVAALTWNSAIQRIITSKQSEIVALLPVKEEYFVDIVVALIVTLIAVVGIMVFTKLLKD